MTQEEVAIALKVTRQTISNWETGTAKPAINKAVDLAHLYGISLDALVGNVQSEKKKISGVMKRYEGFKGILYMQPTETQPFFPLSKIKDVEIVNVEASSIKIRIHKKKIVEQLVFSKDVLCFSKEVR